MVARFLSYLPALVVSSDQLLCRQPLVANLALFPHRREPSGHLLRVNVAAPVNVGLRDDDRLVRVLLHQLGEVVAEDGDGEGDHDDARNHGDTRHELSCPGGGLN